MNPEKNTFPPYNVSWSEANELATRWAHRPDVETEAQALVSYHNRWYLIEKFSDSELGYYIVDRVKKVEFEKIFKELKEHGKITEGQSIIPITDGFSSSNRQGNRVERRKSSSYYDAIGHGREGAQIQRMGQNKNSRRASEDDRSSSYERDSENQQESGTERLSSNSTPRFLAKVNPASASKVAAQPQTAPPKLTESLFRKQYMLGMREGRAEVRDTYKRRDLRDGIKGRVKKINKALLTPRAVRRIHINIRTGNHLAVFIV